MYCRITTVDASGVENVTHAAVQHLLVTKYGQLGSSLIDSSEKGVASVVSNLFCVQIGKSRERKREREREEKEREN